MNFSWRPYHRSLQDQIALDELVKELKAKNPPKPKPIKPEGMREEDFILSLQTSSAQRVLKMNSQELSEYQSRTLPTDWLANKDAKTNDESVGARRLDPIEVSHVESTRRRAKNSAGQSIQSSVTDEKKETANQAFRYSPSAEVTSKEVEERAVNLTKIESQPLKETWVDLTWWQALIHWAKGNKVKSVRKP